MKRKKDFIATLMGVKIQRLLSIREKLEKGIPISENDETILENELDIRDFDDKEQLKKNVSEFFSWLKSNI